MTQPDSGLIPALNESLQIDLPEKISFEETKEKLSAYINDLIQTDFQKLVSLLYRIDVSEQKLKNALKTAQGREAGKIIAELIMERQLQKIKTRQEYSQQQKNK